MNVKKDGAIALYDSGRGVESVLQACRKVLPNEKWLVLQDVHNQPYGSKSDQEITDAGFSCFTQIVKQNVKAIVVACHTSSMIALPHLRKHFSLPMVGMLRPTARLLAEQYQHDEIIWLATPASIQADRLEPLARHLGFSGRVHAIPCHQWVNRIEHGCAQDLQALVQEFARKNRDLLSRGSVKILYGCTHYPLLDKLMKRFLGASVGYINPAISVAESLLTTLAQKDMLSEGVRPSVNFLNSVVFPLRRSLVSS